MLLILHSKPNPQLLLKPQDANGLFYSICASLSKASLKKHEQSICVQRISQKIKESNTHQDSFTGKKFD
ncbi:hypothetical protein ACB092_09G006300 [Castanea dentata]